MHKHWLPYPFSTLAIMRCCSDSLALCKIDRRASFNKVLTNFKCNYHKKCATAIKSGLSKIGAEALSRVFVGLVLPKNASNQCQKCSKLPLDLLFWEQCYTFQISWCAKCWTRYVTFSIGFILLMTPSWKTTLKSITFFCNPLHLYFCDKWGQ